jgi:hypothetical protein
MARDVDSGTSDVVELQEVVLAFQKAMARAAQTTAQAIQDTPAMRYGLRQVYVVQRLEVELRVGVHVKRLLIEERPSERVVVDFSTEPERAARLTFAVEPVPPGEPVDGALLLLQVPRLFRGDTERPAGAAVRPGDRIEVTAAVYNAAGMPVPAIPVWLEITRLTDVIQVRENPAALETLRWLDVLPGRHWTPSRVTNAEGLATFTFTLPRGTLPSGVREGLLRIRAETRLPMTPGAPRTDALTERQPRFLVLEEEPARPSLAPETPEDSDRGVGEETVPAPGWDPILLPEGSGPPPPGLSLGEVASPPTEA